ncbi:ParB N-terminal domain-containing protein [Streptomyces albus]|uniref:ParB/RepB/Spo0J family partition protein n=1 Tax=Streptomyces albus TaxID=1888 RepID=UPI0033DCCCA4
MSPRLAVVAGGEPPFGTGGHPPRAGRPVPSGALAAGAADTGWAAAGSPGPGRAGPATAAASDAEPAGSGPENGAAALEGGGAGPGALVGGVRQPAPATGRGPGVRAVLPVHALVAADSPRLNGEDAEHVRALADLTEALPPILVHRETLRVIDGMHRLRAARLRGDETIEVDFFEGDESDAFALAVRLNITHGLPLSRADRMAAARRLLAMYPYWSNRRIAANAGLSASTIGAMRRRSTGHDEQLSARVGQDGRVRPLRAAEGRLRAGQVIEANPGASLREIAQQAGVAVATAKDVRDRIRQGRDPVPDGLRTERERADAPRRRTEAPAGREEQPPPGEPVAGLPAFASAVRSALANMRKDPSLRTDAGRMLLQLLSAHALGDDAGWDRLVRSVPAHRKDVLAQFARRCAEHWSRFANDLDARRV